MPDLQRAAIEVHVGLDQVDPGGQRRPQVRQGVAGPVGHGEQGHGRKGSWPWMPTTPM
ncbi:hypothetical protein [Asanoa ferruginea]|uniref:hypothetical protein n=1 Tax=Asanoa ferruginea TaxID=53367 RepID=UPI001477196D|nr:hypothetical protein [Asanoa ferruginea]